MTPAPPSVQSPSHSPSTSTPPSPSSPLLKDFNSSTHSLSNLNRTAQKNLIRYLQDLPEPTQPAAAQGEPGSSSSSHGRKNPQSQRTLQRPSRPKLVLMGHRRSGKSSIASVVFQKKPAGDTYGLETTTRIKMTEIDSFMKFQVSEFPGHLNYFDESFDTREILGDTSAIIWVIDAQDDIHAPVEQAWKVIIAVKTALPHIHAIVFIHKMDGLSDDYKTDVTQTICQRIDDEVSDAKIRAEPGKGVVSYYSTSIYDYSIYEALSKVVQKLIPAKELASLESLLDNLATRSRMKTVFLFDMWTKIYIATDPGPAGEGSYEVCSDHIDMVVDMSEIYGWNTGSDSTEPGNVNAESIVMLGGISVLFT